MIKAVGFDIDNTMCGYNAAHDAGLEALYTYCGEHFSMTRKEAAQTVVKAQAIAIARVGTECAAMHNRMIRFQIFLELIGCRDYEKALELYDCYWNGFLDNMEAEPGLMKLLKELKGRGISVGIGSDMTTRIQYVKLKRLGVLPYIDWIVTSEEAGVEKPAKKFFDLCIEKAGCRPDECLFIGDSTRKDVLGAIGAGMIGVRYKPKGRKKEEGYPVIRHYDEVPELLELVDCERKCSKESIGA